MSHCPRCTSEVPEASRFCGQCGSDVTPMDAATATGIGRLSPSDTLDDARFLPGLMIADRYRVIGLLGKGGMGEVGMLANALQGALFVAAITWILYFALEPYMRRLWPDGYYISSLAGRTVFVDNLLEQT